MNKITVFNDTNALKALAFLVSLPEREFIGSEVQAATNLSRAGVYLAMQSLIRQGLVFGRRRAKMHLYSLCNDNAVVRQFKVLTTVVLLNELVKKLQPTARKIILFGSAARGEDTSESDIDLFVLCKDTGSARNVIGSAKLPRKIQPVLLTASEYADMRDKEKVFMSEVHRGITLWEATS